MSNEGTPKSEIPNIIVSDYAAKLAEKWVNEMSKEAAEEEETEPQAEGRPPRLGLGAKLSDQMSPGSPKRRIVFCSSGKSDAVARARPILSDQARQAELFELDNGTMLVKITNLGCTIATLCIPGKDGKLSDVVLGFDSVEPYLKGAAPFFGCIVGRVANRTKEGKFTLNGIEYSLPINEPPNSLHGEHEGFDKVTWEVADYKKGEKPSITFKYHSHDGEEGYPGDVDVTATYTLTSNTTMRLDMEAVPESKATPINLAQHTYWNLAGHDSGNILDHSIQIWANHITPVDDNTIPTGEIMPVKGTAFDFTTEKKIGASIHEVPGLGYDHNYVLDCGEEKSGLKHAAKLKDPSSSRVLDLWTNAPGMQFYTGNYVNGVVGKGGAAYNNHSGVCLETQGFPNAINQPNFPSVVVQPGEKYKHFMLFEFSLE